MEARTAARLKLLLIVFVLIVLAHVVVIKLLVVSSIDQEPEKTQEKDPAGQPSMFSALPEPELLLEDERK